MADSSSQSIGKRIAVIGGGASGLAAAHRLIELSNDGPHDFNVTLFEASNSPGGVAETRRIGEYLVETGPDMFITNQPAAMWFGCNDMVLQCSYYAFVVGSRKTAHIALNINLQERCKAEYFYILP